MTELGNILEHFHFLRPWWLLLLPAWGFVFWVRHQIENQRDMFGGIIAPHLLEHLRLRPGDWHWFNPRFFSTLLFALCLVILMGPTWRQQPSPLNRDDAALVILIDASASMTQRDVQPSRLQRSKQKIADLLALRPDQRTALIAFAGSAHTVLSLTADRDILGQYLNAIEPQIMPRPGKFAEYALPRIDEVLRDIAAPATVLLLTDGVGEATNAAFDDYFDQHQHQLLLLGVGTDRTEQDLVPLERRNLESLATAAGGRYIDLTVDDNDVRRISRRIDAHFVVVDDAALPWLDSGYVLVFPALALFMMWFRRGWTLTWLWLAVPLLVLQPATAVQAQGQGPGAQQAQAETQKRQLHDAAPDQSDSFLASHWFADLWLTPDQQGLALMYRGRYPEAARRFDSTAYKALAYYYAEDFMNAAEYYSRIDSDNALFNEGNARAHARDYLRAVQRYDRLLARNPGYPGAAPNRAKVQAIIDEINRLSESQQQEAGVSGEDMELGGDDVIPAQGADDLMLSAAERVTLSAEDILGDPATRDMWLRGVQQDPAVFLASKFHMQLLRAERSGESAP